MERCPDVARTCPTPDVTDARYCSRVDIFSILTSPITPLVASAAGFVLGLFARPWIEARIGIARERATGRTAFQRDTLTEMQATLSRLDPRLDFEPLDYDPTQAIHASHRQSQDRARLVILTRQVRDRGVVAAMEPFNNFRGHDDDDASRYCDILDTAHGAIARALRDL